MACPVLTQQNGNLKILSVCAETGHAPSLQLDSDIRTKGNRFKLLFAFVTAHAQSKTVLFDLSHSQCTDTYPEFETYPKVIPDYQEIVGKLGARLEVNDSAKITPQLLMKTDVLIMFCPLSNELQKNLTEKEKVTLIDFVRKGGALLFFVDDAHRVDIEKYGANDVVSPFGIEFGRRGIFTCLLRQVREWASFMQRRIRWWDCCWAIPMAYGKFRIKCKPVGGEKIARSI